MYNLLKLPMVKSLYVFGLLFPAMKHMLELTQDHGDPRNHLVKTLI